MLSAQTTDLQVNKVTEKLFKKIQKPEDLLHMGFARFQKAISSINYYKTKTKHIRQTAKLLKQWKKIPNDLAKLMELPWVGIKTAKLILHCMYGQLYIAVDTHIHRVANRLWLVKTTTPEKTSELLEKLIPDIYKEHAHHALVLFGRYYCKAMKPKCEICKLQNMCLYYKKTYAYINWTSSRS